jgi:hypothetical protein
MNANEMTFTRGLDQIEAAADQIDGDRQSAIISAIDAYTKRNGGTLDLSNKSGWHRTQLAFDIVDALRGIK